jgi:hypothetical protein
MKNTNNKQFKKRHELPAPEEIEVDEFLAFTVNINSGTDSMSTVSLYPRYQAFFNHIKIYATVKMFAEWSSKGKFHYHGYLSFTKLANILPFIMYMNDPKVLSNFTYSLKKIFGDDGETKWITYVSKQRHLAKPYLESLKLDYMFDSSKCNKKNDIHKYFDLGDQLRADLDDYPSDSAE